jgi:hypothetical protein
MAAVSALSALVMAKDWDWKTDPIHSAVPA